eukprot:2601533-Prymnesium_polylepis.2
MRQRSMWRKHQIRLRPLRPERRRNPHHHSYAGAANASTSRRPATKSRQAGAVVLGCAVRGHARAAGGRPLSRHPTEPAISAHRSERAPCASGARARASG